MSIYKDVVDFRDELVNECIGSDEIWNEYISDLEVFMTDGELIAVKAVIEETLNRLNKILEDNDEHNLNKR